MRPSNREGVVAVLDTPAELALLQSAISDPNLRQFYPADPNGEWSMTSLNVRFAHQVNASLSVLAGPNYYEEPSIRPGAIFEVLPEDMNLLREAARKVYLTRGLANRAINVITGRRSAARNIRSYLG